MVRINSKHQVSNLKLLANICLLISLGYHDEQPQHLLVFFVVSNRTIFLVIGEKYLTKRQHIEQSKNWNVNNV